MPTPFTTARISIKRADQDTYAKIKQALFAWRAAWAGEIGQVFVTSHHRYFDVLKRRYHRERVLVVSATPAALAAVPHGIEVDTLSLSPIRTLAATTSSAVYSLRGNLIAGTKYFAPGSTVYPHEPHAHDGYERTYVTGPHRDTGHYITLICATHRFINWRIEEVTHPMVIYELRYKGIGWNRSPAEEESVMRKIADFMNERTAASGSTNPQA